MALVDENSTQTKDALIHIYSFISTHSYLVACLGYPKFATRFL